MDPAFWRGRRVFVTGHTGFKGAWLCLWLRELGADVCGYALPAPTTPSLWQLAEAGRGVNHVEADVRDAPRLAAALASFAPEVVLHMAAQSVVLSAREDPVATYATNVMGTVHLFDAVRRSGVRAAVLNVTTDKVYAHRAGPWGYREDDPLGGLDPYANSKACAELVAHSFADTWFAAAQHPRHGVAVACARAGNVVGGGDWTPHQLVPAVVAAAQAGQTVRLRQPGAVRPWQHVLDCLHGYLTLAQALVQRPHVARGDWNFGPPPGQAWSVAQVAQSLAQHWGLEPGWEAAGGEQPREDMTLRLDGAKAAHHLGWHTLLDTPASLRWVAQWHQAVQGGASPREVSLSQIAHYTRARLEGSAA